MSIINCGHLPAVYLPKESETRLIDINVDIIGIFKDVYFETVEIEVKEGDRFFLYSEGLIEKHGEKLFGLRAFKNS